MMENRRILKVVNLKRGDGLGPREKKSASATASTVPLLGTKVLLQIWM